MRTRLPPGQPQICTLLSTCIPSQLQFSSAEFRDFCKSMWQCTGLKQSQCLHTFEHLQSSLAFFSSKTSAPHNFPIVKLSLLPQRKAWTSTVPNSNALFSQKKKASVQTEQLEGGLQTAQANCSNSQQPSETIQRLQNRRTALKGL